MLPQNKIILLLIQVNIYKQMFMLLIYNEN